MSRFSRTLFEELEEEGLSANYRRSVRTTISGTLQTAVRYGLLDRNPVREISPIEGGSRKVRALRADERLRLLASVDQYVVENRFFKYSELPDLVRFLLGTGCRIGEALAVRWRDVNLTNKPVISEDGTVIPPRSVWINGNIVDVTGKGLVRHPGKTENANRFLALPQFVVRVLTARLLIAWSAAKGEELNTARVALEGLSDGGYVETDSEGAVRILGVDESMSSILDDPVFPSRTLGWKHPNNVRRSWRIVRAAIGFAWVTPHVFRTTAATVLDDERLTPRQIADILGHSKPSTTMDLYMGRGEVNEAAAAVLHGAICAS
ncbi:site-specific integrase [Saccharopolyspora thermophila]|uniref:Tyr recombinase domain-containing protein n=1 Tax=Saccharopolyspora thermophila TaxID=89367 RepID=A0ABP3M4B1_9PSEU